jgi:hypothetical protein
MSLWHLELLPVDRALHFEVNFVYEVLGQAEVIFIDAESILVFAQLHRISLYSFRTCM